MARQVETPVTLLYFAWLRERIGVGEERLTLPARIDTVGGLVDWLVSLGDGYQKAFERRETVRCAVNQAFGNPQTAIAGGDEIAFFPPVTGG